MLELDDAKAHLNVTTTDDDALIQAKIDAASAWLASYTGVTYDTTTIAPAPVVEACRQLVATLYQTREASLVGMTAQQLPFGMLDLLAPYRAWSF